MSGSYLRRSLLLHLGILSASKASTSSSKQQIPRFFCLVLALVVPAAAVRAGNNDSTGIVGDRAKNR
jgi:hypothetical protein